MGDQMPKWQQLMQEVLSDVVWQVTNNLQPLCAALPETRPITCMLQAVSTHCGFQLAMIQRASMADASASASLGHLPCQRTWCALVSAVLVHVGVQN